METYSMKNSLSNRRLDTLMDREFVQFMSILRSIR